MATKTLSVTLSDTPTSVTLSDEAGTYGVKRNDSDAVIVAAGTAFTDDGDGSWSYVLTLPLRGLSYNYSVKVVTSNGRTHYISKTYTDKVYVLSETSVKTALGIAADDDTHDTKLQELIDFAVDMAESYTQRKFLTQAVTEYRDAFPLEIRPAWSSLVGVTSITYVDASGDTQTLDSSKYQVITSKVPGKIVPAYGQTWPATRSIEEAVTINYTAGYGTEYSDIPGKVRDAILSMVANRFYSPETGMMLPEAAKQLLGPERVIKL